MTPHNIWIEQCEAATAIEDEFGTDKALAYLIGEKFINFLEAAEADAAFRGEIPPSLPKSKASSSRGSWSSIWITRSSESANEITSSARLCRITGIGPKCLYRSPLLPGWTQQHELSVAAVDVHGDSPAT